CSSNKCKNIYFHNLSGFLFRNNSGCNPLEIRLKIQFFNIKLILINSLSISIVLNRRNIRNYNILVLTIK
ncbi:hypothetical protein M569_00275, partial [Genlisea aurea]